MPVPTKIRRRAALKLIGASFLMAVICPHAETLSAALRKRRVERIAGL